MNYHAVFVAMQVLMIGALVVLAAREGGANQGPEMQVHRDALTGCEYLSSNRGGLVPRTNVDGRQLCTP